MALTKAEPLLTQRDHTERTKGNGQRAGPKPRATAARPRAGAAAAPPLAPQSGETPDPVSTREPEPGTSLHTGGLQLPGPGGNAGALSLQKRCIFLRSRSCARRSLTNTVPAGGTVIRAAPRARAGRGAQHSGGRAPRPLPGHTGLAKEAAPPGARHGALEPGPGHHHSGFPQPAASPCWVTGPGPLSS